MSARNTSVIAKSVDTGTVKSLGTAMMISWTLTIGCGGLVVGLGAYYGMILDNPVLVASSCLLLSTPLILTVTWPAALVRMRVLASMADQEVPVSVLLKNREGAGNSLTAE